MDLKDVIFKLLRDKPQYEDTLEYLLSVDERNPLKDTIYKIDRPGGKFLFSHLERGKVRNFGYLVKLGIIGALGGRIKIFYLNDRKAVEEALSAHRMLKSFDEELISQPIQPVEVGAALFDDVYGYDDVKGVFVKSLEAEKPVSILLVGPPASAKTLFLLCLGRLPRSYYTLGSASSKAGLADYLIRNRPRYLLVDEIDLMSREDYAVLLSLCETGIVSETKYLKTRAVTLKTWVYACANTTETIPEAVLSRFLPFKFKPYDREAFIRTVINVLMRRENTGGELAEYMAVKIWEDLDSRDVRDAIRLARLTENKAEVDELIPILKKYR